MVLESNRTEEQLFDQLISSFVHSVWIALGKLKDPSSGKINIDLFQASMSIDMLDMLYKRMEGNLSEKEDAYLGHLLSELKFNYSKVRDSQDSGEDTEKTDSVSET